MISAPIRMALPVPPIGEGLGAAGDDYVSSIQIELTSCHQSVRTGGEPFQALMLAITRCHLAFHPRTQAFQPGSAKAQSIAARIEARWSSVEAMGEDVTALAHQILKITGEADILSWTQVN